MKYLVTIAYDGQAFHGFQYQPYVRTVQSALNEAVSALFGPGCLVTACSRTDAGVHALASRITIELPNKDVPIPADKLSLAIAPFLPEDISFISSLIVSDSFHVRHDVAFKEYEYLLFNRRTKDPFLRHRAWFYPYPLDEEAFSHMKQACPAFIGTHDFSAFMAEGSPVATTVRTVRSLTVSREGDLVRFRICADGFLYNMVRIIVGTLIDCAKGRIKPDDIPAILSSRRRENAGMTAPPDGLYLRNVTYREDAF